MTINGVHTQIWFHYFIKYAWLVVLWEERKLQNLIFNLATKEQTQHGPIEWEGWKCLLYPIVQKRSRDVKAFE